MLGLLKWDRFAVVMRAATQQVRALDYVAAARGRPAPRPCASSSAKSCRTCCRSSSWSRASRAASAILLEAALSFLGLGVQPPLPSWGLMIAEAKTYMFFSFWLIAIPGTALAVLVLADQHGRRRHPRRRPRQGGEAKWRALLDVEGLTVDIATARGTLHAVRDISF